MGKLNYKVNLLKFNVNKFSKNFFVIVQNAENILMIFCKRLHNSFFYLLYKTGGFITN